MFMKKHQKNPPKKTIVAHFSDLCEYFPIGRKKIDTA